MPASSRDSLVKPGKSACDDWLNNEKFVGKEQETRSVSPMLRKVTAIGIVAMHDANSSLLDCTILQKESRHAGAARYVRACCECGATASLADFGKSSETTYWIEAIFGSRVTCVVPILTTVRSWETVARRFKSLTTWTASAAALEIRIE